MHPQEPPTWLRLPAHALFFKAISLVTRRAGASPVARIHEYNARSLQQRLAAASVVVLSESACGVHEALSPFNKLSLEEPHRSLAGPKFRAAVSRTGGRLLSLYVYVCVCERRRAASRKDARPRSAYIYHNDAPSSTNVHNIGAC